MAVSIFLFNVIYYSEPSLQRQHLFPKTLPLKLNLLLYTERILSRLIFKKGLVLFFSHRTYCGYLLKSPHRGDSNKYPKHIFFKAFLYSCIIYD